MYRSTGFIEPDPVCLRPKVRMLEPPESTGDVRIALRMQLHRRNAITDDDNG